jgi:hypothetical protein
VPEQVTHLREWKAALDQSRGVLVPQIVPVQVDDLVSEQPVVLRVASDSHELALRAATFLAAAMNGGLLNRPPTSLDVPCPACGFFTLVEQQYGSYDICAVCGSEDDCIQLANPTSGGGANRESLAEAQRVAIQKIPPDTTEYKSFRRSQQWRPLSQAEIEDANLKRSKEHWHTHGIVEPADAYWNRS